MIDGVKLTVDRHEVRAWKDGREFLHRCDGRECRLAEELEAFAPEPPSRDELPSVAETIIRKRQSILNRGLAPSHIEVSPDMLAELSRDARFLSAPPTGRPDAPLGFICGLPVRMVPKSRKIVRVEWFYEPAD
ncbi:MAG: hypothetical protein IT480_18765 [Gammaproteobacteria bacterium]|nr:hypothetical protein [Gammaproteobacteria bacterium]